VSRPDGTHHHGLLAGVGAGTTAVLVILVLVLASWHRVSGAVGQALVVIVLAVTAAVILAVIAAAAYAFLWLRHRVRNPELLAGGQAVRAEVLPAQHPGAASQLLAWRPAAAIDPPRASPAGTYAALPGHAAGAITEGK
jgi:hypothetical protein